MSIWNDEIKETILKPGAKWFCEHLREKYRMLFNEDPYFKRMERRKKTLDKRK